MLMREMPRCFSDTLFDGTYRGGTREISSTMKRVCGFCGDYKLILGELILTPSCKVDICPRCRVENYHHFISCDHCDLLFRHQKVLELHLEDAMLKLHPNQSLMTESTNTIEFNDAYKINFNDQ